MRSAELAMSTWYGQDDCILSFSALSQKSIRPFPYDALRTTPAGLKSSNASWWHPALSEEGLMMSTLGTIAT